MSGSLRGYQLALIAVLSGLDLPAQAVQSQTVEESFQAIDTENAYPNTVYLQTELGYCTGFMLNPRTIISARHCFTREESNPDIEAVIGHSMHNPDIGIRTGTGPDAYSDIYQISDIISPEDAIRSATIEIDGEPIDYTHLVNDMVIIALAAPVQGIQNRKALLSPLSGEQQAVMVGYGKSGSIETEELYWERRTLKREKESLNPAIDAARIAEIDSRISVINARFSSIEHKIRQGYRRSGFNIVRHEASRFLLGGQHYEADFDPVDEDYETAYCKLMYDAGLPCRRDNDFPDSIATMPDSILAPGDSGGPLFVEIGGEIYHIGVANGLATGFGLVGGYMVWRSFIDSHNFLLENSPLKYVGTTNIGTGGANWSDNSLWQKLADPGYYVMNEQGHIVAATLKTEDPSQGQNWQSVPDSTANGRTRCDALSEAGATGPNNRHGSHGDAFANCANYFDVTLAKAGTIQVDMDVEIDRLTMRHTDSRLHIPSDQSFKTLMDTQIESGTLEIQGQFESGELWNYGAVMGSGSMRLARFENRAGAHLSAGGMDTTGTLSITGNVYLTTGPDMASSSLLVQNIDENSADLIDVTGHVELGGWVQFDIAAAHMYNGRNFQLLIARGGLDGVFAGTTGLPDRWVALFDYDYQTGNAGVRLIDEDGKFVERTGIAPTPEQTTLAKRLDFFRQTGGNTPLGQLSASLYYQSNAQIEKSLDQLQPHILAETGLSLTASGIGQHISARILQRDASLPHENPALDRPFHANAGLAQIISHMASAAASLSGTGQASSGEETPDKNSVFGQVTWIDGTSHTGQAGGNIGGYSATLGYDKAFGPVLIGVFANYGSDDTHYAGIGQSLSRSAYAAGAYGSAGIAGFRFNGHIAYGRHSLKLSRTVTDQRLSSSTSASEVSGEISLDREFYAFSLSGFHADLRGHLGLAGAHYRREAFTETGNAAALRIEARTSSILQTRAGLDLRLGFRQILDFRLGGEYVYDFYAPSAPVSYYFAEDISSGSLTLVPLQDRHYGEIRASLVARLPAGLSGEVFAAQTLGRSDLSLLNLGAKIHWRF